MPIHSLSLKNFKCFKEVDVDFSRITLLTGANSSGKSSLIYALLGALQTEQFPFYYSPNGDYINMGGYEEIVFNGNEKTEISLDFKIDNADRNLFRVNEFKIVLQSQRTIPTVKDLIINGAALFFSLELSQQPQNQYYSFRLSLSTSNNPVWDKHINNIARFLEDEGCQIKRMEGNIIITKIISDLREIFTWGEKAPDDFGDLLFVFTKSFKKENDFNFISSYRNPPERTYYAKTKAPLRVEKNGNGYVDQIIEWSENQTNVFDGLNALIKEIGLVNNIATRRLEGGRAELKVKISEGGVWSTLADVGFGVSHFLPIIVADLQLNNDSTLAVSQPENDLHPSIQAKFGDYLTLQVRTSRKQYIIETHSEYIINRLRRNIAKGQLKSEDVAVYYLENSDEGSIAHKVTFAKDGQIIGAPNGFFETYMMDVMDIALNAEAE